jgi:hypothetical protein
MSKNKVYNLKPDEILRRVFNYKSDGFSRNDMEELETKIGYKLPKQLRNYYEKYGKLEINRALHPIVPIDEIAFNYNCLNEEFEEDKDDFIGSYGGSIEDIKGKTQNYLMFWRENQGVWNAGILEDDLKKGIDNPPIYMTTEDDLITWKKVSNSVDSFLLSMIIENAEEEYCFDEIDGDGVIDCITEYDIDATQLNPDYNDKLITCWDEDSKILFLFFLKENDEFNTLLIYRIEDEYE